MDLKLIGEKIRYLRQKNKFTLEELGKKINVSKQTLYKYENGVITNIPSDKIEQLAEIYNVSPAYLMGWENIVKPENKFIALVQKIELLPLNKQQELEKIINSNFMIITDEDEQSIIKIYRQIDDRGKRNVQSTIDTEYGFIQSEKEKDIKCS